MPPSTRHKYLLSSHVHLCWTERGAVLLDLKRDRYLGLDSETCHALSGWTEGWRVPAESPPGVSADQPPSSTLELLLSFGILTTDPSNGKTATPISVPRPASALIDGHTLATTRTGFRNALRCLAAVLKARASLRRYSLEQLVTTARPAPRALNQEPFDIATAQRCVASFKRMRPYLFTAQDACLLDSLALRNYLDSHGLSSLWVFGVKSHPFAAHCWLQNGNIILNDTPENVRQFTPIMAVQER